MCIFKCVNLTLLKALRIVQPIVGVCLLLMGLLISGLTHAQSNFTSKVIGVGVFLSRFSVIPSNEGSSVEHFLYHAKTPRSTEG